MAKMRAHVEDTVLALQVRLAAFWELDVRISVDGSSSALQGRWRQPDVFGVGAPQKSQSAARTERVR